MNSRGLKLKKEFEGKAIASKNFGDFIVESYVSSENVSVRFLKTGYRLTGNIKEIRKGSVRDPYYPIVYGRGFCGQGEYVPCHNIDGKKHNTPAYEVWLGIFKRCYHPNTTHNYKECSIDPIWYNFQTFAKWFYDNVAIYGEGGHVDKDLLILGNKVYSPSTCVYIPPEINSLFTGSSRMRGVHFCNNRKKYIAQLQKGEKTTTGKKRQSMIGVFLDETAARLAYRKAKVEHVINTANMCKDRMDMRIYNALTSDPEKYIDYYQSK